ncbi:MAG: hypothetical protein M0T74_16670, partial [Desulfitobacterium hafniense]|nr:hypothetical protein [Desulfitobacterium hafniense]
MNTLNKIIFDKKILKFASYSGADHASSPSLRRYSLGCFTTVSETLMESACEPSAQFTLRSTRSLTRLREIGSLGIGHLLRLIFMLFGGTSMAWRSDKNISDLNSPRPNRSKICTGILIMLLALGALGGCANPPKQGQPGGAAPVIVNIWHTLEGAEGEALARQAKRISDLNPEVLVKVKYIPED